MPEMLVVSQDVKEYLPLQDFLCEYESREEICYNCLHYTS